MKLFLCIFCFVFILTHTFLLFAQQSHTRVHRCQVPFRAVTVVKIQDGVTNRNLIADSKKNSYQLAEYVFFENQCYVFFKTFKIFVKNYLALKLQYAP